MPSIPFQPKVGVTDLFALHRAVMEFSPINALHPAIGHLTDLLLAEWQRTLAPVADARKREAERQSLEKKTTPP